MRMEGLANLGRLRRLGVTPVLVDDDPANATVDGLPVLTGRGGGLDALARCEVVVKSPGISRHSPEVGRLVEGGVTVAGGLGLWLYEADRDRVVCITGTKGKSTTAAIAGHLLDRLGYRCLVAGNIGRPPWDPEAGEGWDVWVVEVSSYQSTDVAASPRVVAVTSLAPDHLDWHGSVEAYYADKLSLCSQPGARRTVADGTSAALRAHAGQLGPSVRWVSEGDPDLDGPWAERLGLPAPHYRRDALIARACLVEMGTEEALDGDRLADAAAGFHPLDHRFRSLGDVAGVEFVDDGLSTNVLPTLAALQALEGRAVALLVGGQDRGIDYGPLAWAVAARPAPTFVATLPAAGARIHDAIAARGGAREQLSVVDFEDLTSATRAAFGWALPHRGVVLLSPAAPSFGQYRDYRERSAEFASAMAACAASRRALDAAGDDTSA
jgi:UDP-N-acetylmuramoylalanine--D-glutamate ligase